MAWKKYFSPATRSVTTGLSAISGSTNMSAYRTNYSSFLPDVYSGHPNRIERYQQYDIMDTDSEVNAALDILAEFCTQMNKADAPFEIKYKEQASSTEIKLLSRYLQQWNKLQNFNVRIFKLIRNLFKYGDVFFVCDPETQKWIYVDPSKVVRIIVNESEGKKPEQYVIRDLNINLESLAATAINPQMGNIQVSGGGSQGYDVGGGFQRGMVGGYPSQGGSRFQHNMREYSINAEHVVHLSLSEGLDNNFPFGNSLLEMCFKVFKQKELLEDAIIIYRVMRAPERRIFYIDVGNMPPHLAMGFVERVKNEVNQRRIPSVTGGQQSVIDASFNPLAINEDYFFPQTAEGRGSKVDTLPGGANLGEIDDLRFFTNKLYRALRIPSSYLPTGPEDGQAQFTDGRVGTAYIQELRFNKYCERLQSLFEGVFDQQFKLYLENSGINVDPNIFDISFNPPLNFAAYRQIQMDTDRVGVFTQLAEVTYMSKRFALKRYLGLTEEEIAENERLWRQENLVGQQGKEMQPGQEMRGVGITPGGIQGDLSSAEEGEMPPEGIEPPGMESAGGAAPQPGTQPPAPTPA
jgi:Bacteriophage T4-like portal protein (Gp20)